MLYAPHSRQLIGLIVSAAVRAARKCQHVHLVAKVEDDERAVSLKQTDYPPTQFFDLRGESKSRIIHLAAKLL